MTHWVTVVTLFTIVNPTRRYERELFVNLKEAKVLLEDYRGHYNNRRPHGALGYLTPAEFAAVEALAGQGPDPSEQLESVQRLSS